MISRYNAYKDSGVEWIGEIPEHWEVRKLKNLAKICNGKDYQNISMEKGGYPVYGTGGEFARCEKFLYNKPSVLLGRKGTIDNPLIVTEPFWTSDTMYYTEINEDVITKFFFYLVKQINFDRYRYGSAVPSMTKSVYDEMYFPYCQLPEQTQIVSYLDEKTALIDKLISVKQRKIELLKEKRTALIDQAVTKGLNPNVKMKDSGVEWIGEIPEHWEITRFKYDSTSPVKYGLNISSDSYKEEGIRFIRITDIAESGVLICENGVFLEKKDVPKEFLLKKNDVLFCRSGHTVGKSYLHQEDGEFTSGGYLVRFNFQNSVEARFIFLLGKTKFYWDWIKLNSVVSTIENVNGDKFQNFQYARPPFPEQAQIVSYLDEKTKEIDDLLNIEQKKIDLLKEYRQSLISEVVTGKIKVYENNLTLQQTLENG